MYITKIGGLISIGLSCYFLKVFIDVSNSDWFLVQKIAPSFGKVSLFFAIFGVFLFFFDTLYGYIVETFQQYYDKVTDSISMVGKGMGIGVSEEARKEHENSGEKQSEHKKIEHSPLPK